MLEDLGLKSYLMIIMEEHTPVYTFELPRPDITSIDIGIGKSLNFTPVISKTKGVKKLYLKGSTVSGFNSTYADLNSGYQFKFEYDIRDYINNNNQIQFEAPSDKSYYYSICAEDIYGSGLTYVYPSSVKPFSLDPISCNNTPDKVRAKVFVDRDTFFGTVTTDLYGSFSRDRVSKGTKYEVSVFKSGYIDTSESFFIEPPSIKNINSIYYGTGTKRADRNLNLPVYTKDYYYSGVSGLPVFSTYNETGIQWTDHTLILSNEGSLKQGLTTGQSIIKEVAIAAGNSNSRKVYFGIEFDKNSERFVFYPSGGYYGSGIYTGTYADEPTGGYYVYENYGPSGPSGQVDRIARLVLSLRVTLL